MKFNCCRKTEITRRLWSICARRSLLLKA